MKKRINAWSWVALALVFCSFVTAIVTGVIIRNNEEMSAEQMLAIQQSTEWVFVLGWSGAILICCAQNIRSRKKVWAVLIAVAAVALATVDLVYCSQVYAAEAETNALQVAYRQALATNAENERDLGRALLEAYSRQRGEGIVLNVCRSGLCLLSLLLPALFSKSNSKE